MNIGDRVKIARKAAGFSLRALAEKVGVSANAISKYETDKDLPSSRVMIRLSQALGVPVDFFLRPINNPVQIQAFRKRASQILKTLWGESTRTNQALDYLFGAQGKRGILLFSDAYLVNPQDPQQAWCSMDVVKKPPVPQAGSIIFSPSCGLMISTMNWVTARGV